MRSPLDHLPTGGEGMGLFEKTHLPDQTSSTLCRGPSRGMHCKRLMVSTTFYSSWPQRGPFCSVGLDASWNRVKCRALRLYTSWRRRHGALRKDASFGSKHAWPMLRPESRAAGQRPNRITILAFQQIAGRAACNVGVDASWRRVPCRAVRPAFSKYGALPYEVVS